MRWIRPRPRRRTWVQRLTLMLALAGCLSLPAATAPAHRGVRNLDNQWLFQTNGAPASAWKPVRLPATFQDYEGTNFHGVGWYRTAFKLDPPRPGQRVLIHFQAAATAAEVWCNGVRLGSHLGGWTPFRFDVTEALHRSTAPGANGLRVRLDEKVGHNTQGFLPIVEPHFGGLWQGVELLTVAATYIDDLRLRAVGNPKTGRLELEIPLAGDGAAEVSRLTVEVRPPGSKKSQTFDLALSSSTPAGPQATRATLRREGNLLFAEIPVAKPRLWSPTDPALYNVLISLPSSDGGQTPGDQVRTRAAFRTVEASGHQLRLNGQPLNVRGLLNWGYYPPELAPIPDEARFRRDLEFARRRGFNLMKFCLWVPPQRYLELCDESGMLAWMEYPTWHPQLTPEHLESLRREFGEFFHFDRNHPSVILRSLTCETGASADLGVIRALYDTAKRLIPGALVEDDSSWIEWNRVTDFYDDHPYGNNDTWVPTLRRLTDYVAQHDAKPLVLGEAMAADTWPRMRDLERRLGKERPYWAPKALDAQQAWLARMTAIAGPEPLRHLQPDSMQYGLLMRKYQAETYRREVPDGGYVISVIRDIPSATMGLIDYLDDPKWPATDWAWQRDTICLLQTENDRRSFAAGKRLKGALLVSHFGSAPIRNGKLEATLGDTRAQATKSQEIGTLKPWLDLDLPLPTNLEKPERLVLCARLKTTAGEFRNEWPVWVVPAPPAVCANHVWVDPALAPTLNLPPAPGPLSDAARDDVVVAARLDDALARRLENGGRVLLLPDGGKGSFKLEDHWFLRGAPYVNASALGDSVPRELLVELQHFDLASRVIPNPPWLDQIDPILMLWDTHDLSTVKTHGLIFETRVGAGRLLVSAVNHRGETNAVGRWLLDVLIDHLANGRPSQHLLSDSLWRGLKAKLHEDKLPLVDRTWRFKPEPKAAGFQSHWAAPDWDDSAWSEIKIGRDWESQGWPKLDGWAWYRLKVKVPETWQGRSVYLTFEGVDDLYELFIDGKLFARRGDLAAHKDTFNETFSHDLTQVAKPGAELTVAVRVHDWYGAGGIFRPVTLATTPWAPELEVFR